MGQGYTYYSLLLGQVEPSLRVQYGLKPLLPEGDILTTGGVKTLLALARQIIEAIRQQTGKLTTAVKEWDEHFTNNPGELLADDIESQDEEWGKTLRGQTISMVTAINQYTTTPINAANSWEKRGAELKRRLDSAQNLNMETVSDAELITAEEDAQAIVM